MRAAVAARPGVTTPNPNTEKEVTAIFVTLFRRLAITCVIMMVVGFITTAIAKVDRSSIAPIIFLSILFGISIAYLRGVKAVFGQVKRLGIERFEQRKYADAILVLENFRRSGNRGQDGDGEGHYYLFKAYQALDQAEKMPDIVEWMAKHRAKSPWNARLQQENTAYLQKRTTTQGKPTSEETNGEE